MTHSAADAEHERSIAMFMHATAVEGLKDRPDITIKWVNASELQLSDEGVCRDGDGTRVRCVWKSAPWRSLLHLFDLDEASGASGQSVASDGHGAQHRILRKLVFSQDVHVYQVSGLLASFFIRLKNDTPSPYPIPSLCGPHSLTARTFCPSCAPASPMAA